MTHRYLFPIGIAAGALLAVLISVSHMLMEKSIIEQGANANALDITGRQRMLSQRTALFSLDLVNAEDAVKREQLKGELLQTIDLMESSHNALIKGGKNLNLPNEFSPGLSAVYFEGPTFLDKRVREFVSRSRKLAAAPPAKLTRENPDLQYVLSSGSSQLLGYLDKAVKEYLKTSKANIETHKAINDWTDYMTLAVLGFMAAFVFVPMVRRIKRETLSLEEANDRLEEHVRERTRELTISEETLKESQARLQSILDNTLTVIYLKDVQGRYILVNRRYEDLFNITGEEIVGKTDHDIFPPEIADAFRTNDKKVLKAGAPLEFEEATAHPDGTHTYISMKFPVSNTAGVIYGVCGISTDITGRKQDEEELKRSREQLRNLSLHLRSVQEEERARIARDIHDDLGQILTALDYDLSLIARGLRRDQKPLIEKSKAMKGLVDSAIKAVQRITSELRPTILDDLGLMAAMEWQAQEYQNRTSILCAVDLDHEEVVIPDRELSTALFRAFQEALTNVARHAEATEVDVRLKKHDNELVLEVADNGKGITEKEIFDAKSVGLTGIRERFHPLGGRVEINGVQGKGTTITITAPLNKERAGI